MKFLNIGCGANRPVSDLWVNIDNLHSILEEGTPERNNLDREFNYVDMDITKGLGFEDYSFNGVLASHIFEHFDLQGAIELMKECKRVLKPKGVLRVSTPCPHLMYDQVKGGYNGWGEYCPEGLDFMRHALLFPQHKQILDLQGLKCLFHHVGFASYYPTTFKHSVLGGLAELDNREKFSVYAEAIKGEFSVRLS